MIRRDLDNLPEFALPEGYGYRLFRIGDESVWAGLETAAGPFESHEAAMRRFAEEFGPRIREMQENCFFLLCGERPVGTATAWYNEDFLGQSCGRLHWVAIHPDFQGRGLAKPMISLALKSLRKRYTRCYLTTDTHRLRAIRIYLDFGFEPHIATDLQREAWSRVAVELGHPGFGT